MLLLLLPRRLLVDVLLEIDGGVWPIVALYGGSTTKGETWERTLCVFYLG